MKRLLWFIPFLLCLQAHASCPTSSMGNSVTCVNWNAVDGGSTNQSSGTLSFSPTAGHSVVVFGYMCDTSTCTGANNGLTLAISNNINATGCGCYETSPSSPAGLQGNAHYKNWGWYYPSISSGVTTFTATCSTASSCSFISIYAIEFTGMCTTSPCMDGDGFASGNSTTVADSTSAARYTKDLVISLLGTATDVSSFTPTSSAVTIFFSAGNGSQAITTNAGGVHTDGATLSGSADEWGILTVNVRSAAGVLICSNPITLTGVGCR